MTTQLPTSGFAVYLEFYKPGQSSTTQILFMPEGLASSHQILPLSMYRRRINNITPRKTWRLVANAVTVANARAAVTTTAAAIEKILQFSDPLFVSLESNGWKLRKAPIVVEVTPEDLECVRLAKTPYKVFGRVWKVRKQLGFPKEFIVPEAI
jgi:hypothetical protein